jgi:hypothetical protein
MGLQTIMAALVLTAIIVSIGGMIIYTFSALGKPNLVLCAFCEGDGYIEGIGGRKLECGCIRPL